MKVTVVETRVYKAYFDTGDFDPYATPGGTKVTLPLFGVVVLAADVKEAMAKVSEAFPNEVVQSIHCQTEGLVAGRGKIQPEKVIW